jgi:hypothetical protein
MTNYHRSRVWERMELRELIDGRLVAPRAPEHHGKVGTYKNWGCRCEPCTAANTATWTERARKRRAEQ